MLTKRSKVAEVSKAAVDIELSFPGSYKSLSENGGPTMSCPNGVNPAFVPDEDPCREIATPVLANGSHPAEAVPPHVSRHRGEDPVPPSDKCDFGPLTCLRACQRVVRVEWFVAAMCAFCFLEGVSINGMLAISLTTIEKRFELNSSQSGFIISSADIGATAFVVFVSYFGAKGHKPRVLALGSLFMGAGSFFIFLPHLLVGNYKYNADTDPNSGTLCNASRPDPCADSKDVDKSASAYLPLFSLGQVLQGIGFTPAYTVGAAYVDENTTPEKMAFFMGLIYAVTALGVAVGYVAGGQLLNIWVDTGRVDTDSILLDPSNPQWVGAWWIGFLVTTCLYLILAPPIASFPARLSGTRSVTPDPSDQTEADSEISLCSKILAFPKAILALTRNHVYVIIVLVGSMESLLFTGLGAFAAKMLEEKFDINPDTAGLILGAVLLVGAAGGMVLGGFLVKRYHMSVKGIVRLCLVNALLALLMGGGFFLNCPEMDFAGVTVPYGDHSAGSSYSGLTSKCNENCRCLTDDFNPVCGNDGITYFSPCHAGCNSSDVVNGSQKIFTDCSCVATNSSSWSVSSITTTTAGALPTAIPDACTDECVLLWVFLPLLLGALLTTFITVTPLSIAILRCVPDDKRSLGLGVQWACLRLLGTIPGPVLTGFVLDRACYLWQMTCQGQGSCWIYDRYRMSWSLFAWWAAVKLFSIAMMTLLTFTTRHYGQTDNDDPKDRQTNAGTDDEK